MDAEQIYPIPQRQAFVSGVDHRAKALANVPPMLEDATWRAIDPRDRHRIACDRVGMCGKDAHWATQQGTLYVCDYHRFLFEVQRIVDTIDSSQLTAVS
jgi:hypothetical protein